MVGRETVRVRVEIQGVVQGVGFRPFCHNLAQKIGLTGWIRNSAHGAALELEGEAGAINRFFLELQQSHPPRARITRIRKQSLTPSGGSDFQILASERAEAHDILISPDLAICRECRQEVVDPRNRRYQYPFTNCVDCGPRFTIIRNVPYDRVCTSMSSFEMCPECQQEYLDPGKRRFHAQPNACHRCGPRVWLTNAQGEKLAGDWASNFRRLIRNGNVIAVKGLGGFHLACDARNTAAINKLRSRKKRSFQPLTVMCRDLDVVKGLCRVSELEARWLTSPEAPIVILERLRSSLPDILAPKMKTLGVMLPYTPLHLLLFDEDLYSLVMTSGNLHGLPLVKENHCSLEQLNGLADYFVLHNREIEHRCDDSLGRVVQGGFQLARRSRGFVPLPISVPPLDSDLAVLGMGGEMKNTFCLLKDHRALLSQHLGEMDFEEGIESFLEALGGFQELFQNRPATVAYDLHPGYRISALALELPVGIKIPVQHHHAHMAACMAENGLDREVIGVICDGTGYGTDGSIWGFEILTGDYFRFERKYHLEYVPMPGGERAVQQPWRMALAYLYRFLGDQGLKLAHELLDVQEREIDTVWKMLKQRFNTPLTSSCGRLFDAVAALLGICYENTYEGQAAVEMGELVSSEAQAGSYPFKIDRGKIDPAEIIAGIAFDLRSGENASLMVTRFHNSVIAIIQEAVLRVSQETGLSTVVLSGGAFQNSYLLEGVIKGLRGSFLEVCYHQQVPTNDGGLSLGQAMIGARLTPPGVQAAMPAE